MEANGIGTGKMNDVVDGIRIKECNRATVYEEMKGRVQELLDYQAKNYAAKGIKSVVYGVRPVNKKTNRPTKHIQYAVFCQDGFITDVT